MIEHYLCFWSNFFYIYLKYLFIKLKYHFKYRIHVNNTKTSCEMYL